MVCPPHIRGYHRLLCQQTEQGNLLVEQVIDKVLEKEANKVDREVTAYVITDLFRYGSIWATLGLPKKFTPWSFESFSHFFLDFSKKKAKIFEI